MGNRMMKTVGVVVLAQCLAGMEASAAQPIPKQLFGQNLEHTRSCVQGGISAQLVRNRKFAGKPTSGGLALEWSRYGNGVFEHLDSSFTRHAAKTRMWRWNEMRSQMMTCLDSNGEAGISQDRIALRAGVSHTFRAAVRVLAGGSGVFVGRVVQDGKVVGERKFTISAARDMDWKRISFSFTPEKTGFAELQVGICSNRTGVVGCVSLMADDNFHGMRADVVDHLKAIGTSIIRWPGGNFAGEYQWRDGYIQDRDERAPLQSYTEIETHPYTYGYDQNDLASDDIIALCEKIGAEPFFTINAVFDTPQGSADWVKRTAGKVKRWSLGNEMGYAHMEGPKGAKGYADMVRPHAQAMKAADPSILVTASGRFPWGGDDWIRDVALGLNDLAPVVSYHKYSYPGPLVFCTPGRTQATYANVEREVKVFFDMYYKFRPRIPAKVRVSLDEWNVWASWYREDGPVEGLFAAKMLHRFMREWEKMGLEDVCYFQAVNENAIRVSPFDSRITSIGHAMRLMKAHVGGLPVEWPNASAECFATDAPDGTRYATFLNFSTEKAASYAIPVGGRTKVADGELLEPNGFATGARFASKKPDARLAKDVCTVVVPPASLVCVRLAR